MNLYSASATILTKIWYQPRKISQKIPFFVFSPHFSFYVSGGGAAVCLILSWQDCHTQISSQTKFPPISPPKSSISWKFMKAKISPVHGNTLWKAFNSWCFSPWDTEERSLHANVMSIPESYGTSNKIVQAPTTLLSISKQKKKQYFTHINTKLLRALNISRTIA